MFPLPLPARMRHRNSAGPDPHIARIAAHAPEGDKPRGTRLRLACTLALAMLLPACAGEGPEARLRATVAAMEDAVEARRPGDFVAHVADDFVGGREGLDRQSLRGLLAGQMLGSERIEVVLGSPDIVLHGERATLSVEALVVGGRYLPERGVRLRIVSGWRLEDGAWRCYTAEWTRL